MNSLGTAIPVTSAPLSSPSILREEIPVRQPLGQTGTPMLGATGCWFNLHKMARGVPFFSAFQPFSHPELLPHISVFEQIEGRYRCNLIGERARASLPGKIAKRFLDEIVPDSIAEDITMRFERAHEDALPNYVERCMTWNPDHNFMQYRVLNLPFLGTASGNRRIVSVIDFETPVR